MRELYKQAKKRYRVPDTAHDCPILRIGVVHDQPVSERKNLWNVELFSFFHSQFLHHKTTVISIYSNSKNEYKIFSTAERELRSHRFSSYPGTPSTPFLVIRALPPCLFCVIFWSCYRFDNAVGKMLLG